MNLSDCLKHGLTVLSYSRFIAYATAVLRLSVVCTECIVAG